MFGATMFGGPGSKPSYRGTAFSPYPFSAAQVL
jgi:hypothetical protein